MGSKDDTCEIWHLPAFLGLPARTAIPIGLSAVDLSPNLTGASGSPCR